MTDRPPRSTTFVRVIGALLLAAAVPWSVVALFNHGAPRPNATPLERPQIFGPPPQPPQPPQPPKAAEVSSPDEIQFRSLPPLTAAPGLVVKWDGLQGLTATALDLPPVVAGQRPLKLALTSASGPHRLGMLFSGIAPDARFHLTVWAKTGSATRAVMDFRDGPNNNKGVVLFDAAAAAIVSSSGNFAGLQIARAADGWVKLLVQSRSADGRVIVYFGPLGKSDETTFVGTPSLELTLGGMEVDAIN